MESFISSERHERVFFIGDIHGDALVLFEFALSTGVFVSENPTTIPLLASIHRTYTPQKQQNHATLLGDDSGLHHLHWKCNDTSIVVLVGDVVDNYRYGSQRPHASITQPLSTTSGIVRIANMAMDSERHIVNTLQRLQKEAAQQGGKIVWILGNHDVGNVLNDINCSHYTSLDQCYPPPNTKFFKADRTLWIKEAIIAMNAVVMCVIDDMLVCHGGLSPQFIEHCMEENIGITMVNHRFQEAIKMRTVNFVRG